MLRCSRTEPSYRRAHHRGTFQFVVETDVLARSANLFQWARASRGPAGLPGLFRQLAKGWRSLERKKIPPESTGLQGQQSPMRARKVRPGPRVRAEYPVMWRR